MPTPTAQSGRGGIFAAVDLGSNSFHLIVVRVQGDSVQVIDRMREMVRLGAGLDPRNNLLPEARLRALDCLRRFGERLRDIPTSHVRVVGTNTLRRAHNARDFLAEAEALLHHPIEIVSGIEEARLIYLGVAHSLPASDRRRLVVDIGGGSTELILGAGFEPLELESLYMGCVGMSQRFFPNGIIDKSAWKRAELAAALELEGQETRFRKGDWNEAIGASGTAKALARIAVAEGWSDEGITPGALKKMRKACLAAGHVDRIALKGLSDERRPVFPGGLVVMSSIFSALGIEFMRASEGALREGLIYDQLGRLHSENVRSRSVAAVARRYSVDTEQAGRVRSTALSLLSQAMTGWGLEDEEWKKLLGWGAELHEMGLAIAHSHYHRHGAYVAAHADLPGFSRTQQQLLAALIRGHRRKFPVAVFGDLPAEWQEPARRLCVLLRLAVDLHRSRSPAPLPPISLQVSGSALRLEFPRDWLTAHPLTTADLEAEREALARAGFELDFA